jgi:hypothetical protein
VPSDSVNGRKATKPSRNVRKEIIEWGLLGVGGVLVYLLAVYGWWATGHSTGQAFSFSEILNMALDTLSGKSYLLIDRSPIPPNEALGYASMGAKILLGFAVIKGSLVVFGARLRVLFFRSFAKGHTIVCGAGERGDAIARKILECGEKVAVIDIDMANEKLGELKDCGAHVIHGNAHDATVLRQAAVARARRIIAVTSKDETNLAVCREATNMSPCEARAGVESFEIRSYFSDRLPVGEGGGKIRLESFQCRAARQLMVDIAVKLARSPELRSRGARVLVEAADPFRDEILRAAAVMLQISGDRKPTLHVTSADDDDKRSFERRFPAASLVVDIRWYNGSAAEAFPEGSADLPDAAVFALISDAATLEHAERYRLWHPAEEAGRQIFALIRSTSELHDLARSSMSQTKGQTSEIRNLFGLGLGEKDPLDLQIETNARICHAIYTSFAKNADHLLDPVGLWTDLEKESFRESNRLAAMHHEVKRSAWGAKGSQTAQEMLAHLARCEHMRWMAAYVMDGWRWSESRDNNKLKHPSLKPFDALSDHEKDKDYNAFLWAIGPSDEELNVVELEDKVRRLNREARDISRGPSPRT